MHAAYLTTKHKVTLISVFQTIFVDSYTDNSSILDFH